MSHATCGGISEGLQLKFEKVGDWICVREVSFAKRRRKMQNKSATCFKPNLLKNTWKRVVDREVLSGVRRRGIAKAPLHGGHAFDVG